MGADGTRTSTKVDQVLLNGNNVCMVRSLLGVVADSLNAVRGGVGRCARPLTTPCCLCLDGHYQLVPGSEGPYGDVADMAT